MDSSQSRKESAGEYLRVTVKSLFVAVTIMMVLASPIAYTGVIPGVDNAHGGTAQAATESWSLLYEHYSSNNDKTYTTKYVPGNNSFVYLHHGSPFVVRDSITGSEIVRDSDSGNRAMGDYDAEREFGIYADEYHHELRAWGGKSWIVTGLSEPADADFRHSNGYSYVIDDDGIQIRNTDGTHVKTNTKLEATHQTLSKVKVFETEGIAVAVTNSKVQAFELGTLTSAWNYSISSGLEVAYSSGNVFVGTTGGDVVSLDASDGTHQYTKNPNGTRIEGLAADSRNRVYAGSGDQVFVFDGSDQSDITTFGNASDTIQSLSIDDESGENVIIGIGGGNGGELAYETTLSTEKQFAISGEVTDQEHEDIANASIEVTNSSGSVVGTTTTNHLGDYTVSGLTNGTYNVTATKANYTSETKTVSINGSGEVADFQLKKFDQSITLDVRMYMEHGETYPYEVVVSVNGDRSDVTSEATVTSGDTSVVTIDSVAEEVIATSDTSVNNRTFVRAEWTDDDGNVYTAERNVTVANATVENIAILPSFTRATASLSDDTLKVIIVATMVGAAAALIATSFAGISAMTMIMLLGWLAGMTNNGMAIVTVLIAMFIGMNVAGNVDYTVRRG